MNIKQWVLLELAVENPVPVSNALYHVEHTWPITFSGLFNRKPLGITLKECCHLLWELKQRQFIAFYHYRRDPFRLHSSALELTRAELMAALRIKHGTRSRANENLLFYQLTPTGGATWENLANANWNHFLSHEEGYWSDWQDFFMEEDVSKEPPFPVAPEQQERLQVRLKSPSLQVAEERYQLDAETFGTVIPDSRQDQILTSWRPVYWKTLPIGYQIGYSIYSRAEMQVMSIAQVLAHFEDDPRRYTPRWYKQAPERS